MSTRILCSECVRKQEEIFRLREKIKRLQAQLRYQARTQPEGYFGSSTPSSKKPVKANTKAENTHKHGGARHGHPGAGRTSVRAAQADVIETIDYEPLLRDIQDLAQEFPKNKEIAQFVETTAPLLAQAMGLRTLPIDKATFYQKAKELKQNIINTMNHQATHPGIQKIQTIFRENPHRLYHWADDPNIPAENNFAERQLRRMVIARKISFGSQSDKGAKIREILMTVLATLQQRNPQTVVKTLTDCLDELATNPHATPYAILFPDDTS